MKIDQDLINERVQRLRRRALTSCNARDRGLILDMASRLENATQIWLSRSKGNRVMVVGLENDAVALSLEE